MRNYNIAVIGAGTAGLSSAIFLQKAGCRVVIFEKFATARPLGAGLLLQPTGLSVLKSLNLDEEIIGGGSIIHKLYGKASGSRFTTLDVEYRDYNPDSFGVGVHRGNLFLALYNQAIAVGIEIKSGNNIVDCKQEGCGNEQKATLINDNGEAFGEYDLVIDASGQKSCLRQKYATVKLDKPYPYGAIWGVVKIPQDNQSFALNTLEQRYKNAYHMIGMLPIGRAKDDDATRAAFFWSMKTADYPKWREGSMADWRDYVASLWPESAALLEQFQHHDDLTLATYRDVILRQYHHGNIVFIGDAAHCTSPQLGQGANLALIDAAVLAKSLGSSDTIAGALAEYDGARRSHLKFYQTASRLLTPFFQSDSLFFAKLRFLACGLACHVGFARKIAANVLIGSKSGLFSNIKID